MSIPTGTRDGSFVKFEGWDIPGNDVAYYNKYQGDVKRLKDIVSIDKKWAFCAFNTNGWVKAVPFINGSSFKQAPGTDLYVRVEYPGWKFFAGKDHSGNDLYRITEYNTFPSLTAEIDSRTALKTEDPQVAAFNTNGYVKYKIQFPLYDWTSASSLDGIYVKTDFLGFNFFPQADSPSNDIARVTAMARDVPSLIQECRKRDDQGALGFNTWGWVKNRITVPPPAATSVDETEGIYVQTEWPDFVYLPGVDSNGSDNARLEGKNVAELIKEARKDAKNVAFNTNGWIKNDVADKAQVFSPLPSVLFGTYVKVPTEPKLLQANPALALRMSLFILKGTAAFWAFYMLPDSAARLEYSKAVAEGCKEITEYVAQSKLKVEEGVQMALNLRQQLLVWARQKSSALGQELFQKDYAGLTRLQTPQVMKAVLEHAGRASPKITLALKGAGMLCKALVPMSVANSLVSVAIAPDWDPELAEQMSAWSRAISSRSLPREGGVLMSKPGAILGGIAGTIVATIVDNNQFPVLTDWFYGGTSRESASAVLGHVYEPTRQAVIHMLEATGKEHHVHGVYASHVAAIEGDDSRAAEIAEAIVSTSGKGGQSADDEVPPPLIGNTATSDCLC
ncbi:hypothetical protein CDD81_7809 [Ophiocordyceps australis]|uniref:Uncharacterized protein n=1 Tax=Ophiocordyceps australis TaxID=1399860 RepID=A0A2C5YET3_9HYPO|nr:hypothetical protein CDD81_7809 [Ophiocordyceps australis]